MGFRGVPVGWAVELWHFGLVGGGCKVDGCWWMSFVCVFFVDFLKNQGESRLWGAPSFWRFKVFLQVSKGNKIFSVESNRKMSCDHAGTAGILLLNHHLDQKSSHVSCALC